MKNIQRHFLVIGFSAALLGGGYFAQLAFADPMTGGNPPYEDCAPPCSVSCYEPPPRCPWYIRAEAIGLRRDPYGNSPFAALGPYPNNIALSTSELDRQFKAGAQLLLGHTIADTPFQIEGSYFRIDDWDTSAAVSNFHVNPLGGIGNLYSPFTNFGNPATPVFDYNALVAVRNTSRLDNGELNVKYLLPMPQNGFSASFLLGVRYAQVSERLFYDALSSVPPGSQVGILTRTSNDLIGPQIGGAFDFFTYRNSWISFEMRGAICGNTAMQETTDAFTGHYVRNDRVVTAFVGDLQLMFNWRLTSHCLTRFGYQAMWIDGLSLATRNFGSAGTALELGPTPANSVLDAGGTTVYHGPHLGVEITW